MSRGHKAEEHFVSKKKKTEGEYPELSALRAGCKNILLDSFTPFVLEQGFSSKLLGCFRLCFVIKSGSLYFVPQRLSDFSF